MSSRSSELWGDPTSIRSIRAKCDLPQDGRHHSSIRGVIEHDMHRPEAQKYRDLILKEFADTLVFQDKPLTPEDALALRGESGAHKILLKDGAQPKYYLPDALQVSEMKPSKPYYRSS